MSGIVCAIRGGPASNATIDRSILLAKETDLPLHFLYVINLDFLTHTNRSRTHTLTDQMNQMGEFILLTAQAAAEAHGVTAHGVVRHGVVRDEISKLCHEIAAEYLVVGRPKGQQEKNVFTHDLLQEFVDRIEAQTGATVVLAEEQAP